MSPQGSEEKTISFYMYPCIVAVFLDYLTLALSALVHEIPSSIYKGVTPPKGQKLHYPQLWEQPHTLGIFSNRKYKCFLLLIFSICHICLRWDPFCSPRNDNRESKCISVPHSLAGFLTQRNGHRQWGHTRVSAICAEGNCLHTSGWGKMHLLVKRRRKFYLFWKAIKDFNKGQ